MLIGMVVATAAILATQLGLIGLFMGVGLLVRRAFGLRSLAVRDLLTGFWVGLAAIVAFLLLWTFFARVNAVPLAVVTVFGLGGLGLSAGELRQLPRREAWCFTPVVLLVLVVGALWVANLGRGGLTNTDSLLYHLQGVRWATAYATVPGLANLFGPLGFNNASLLYDAMLEVGPWAGRSHHVANGVLIQVLLFQSLLGLFRLVGGRAADRAQNGFDALLLAPTLAMGIQDWLTSYVTDLPASAVVLVAVSEAHRILLNPAARPPGMVERRHDSPPERLYSVVVIVALLSVAVTFKLSLAVFAGLTTAILLLLVFRDGIFAGARRRTAIRAVGAAALIGGLWAGRGIVLSGYPLFPMTVLPAPVDWRVPAEHAIAEFGYAAESSRATTSTPAGVLHTEPFGAWFERWWELSGSDGLYHIAVPVAFILLVLVGLAFATLRGRRDPSPRPWLLLGPAVVALAAWFRVAPEPRYAAPLLWIVLGLVGASLYRALDGANAGRLARGAVIALAVLGASPLILRPLVSPGADGRLSPLRRVVEANLRLQGQASGLYREPRRPTVRTYVTERGLELNVAPRRCGDAPLPCTPNPAANLRLRIDGRLDRGFMVEGPWMMENWPAGRPVFGRAWAERRRRESAAKSPS
ncbi:MAG: LIC_10190 family membrane protein [Gemmatimonadales bacterium]